MKAFRAGAGVLLIAMATTPGAGAQATGMPTFFAPTRAFGTSELGVSLSRPGGSATGLEGRFGAALNRADVALRAGYVESGGGSDGHFVAGAEARVPVLGRTETFPLDGALVLGAGAAFADGGERTFVPVGLTVGRRVALDGDALQLTPYVQPTVIFADGSIFAFGLGLDLRIRGVPEVRVNWAAGDMDGFSISLFWPR